MDNLDNIIIDVCNRENNSNLYNIRIDGIPVYYYLQRYTRVSVLNYYGCEFKEDSPSARKWERNWNIIKSIFHMSKIFLLRKKYDNFIYSFGRTDMVNGLYMDKFTDPLIDESNIGGSYVIFEPDRAGRHMRPRIHRNSVIYSDAIMWFVNKIWKFYYKNRFEKRNSKDLYMLYEELVKTFPEVKYDIGSISRIIAKNNIYNKFYQKILKKVEAKRFIAPSRADFLNRIPVAKQLNIKVIELQHGITYGETPTYSGFHDNLFTPDYFLSFGKIHSARCYGISEDKIVEIGWAFNNYIRNLGIEKGGNFKGKVLIISSPDISEKMVNVTCQFAEKHPDIQFYFRPHPNEQLDDCRLERLNTYTNIKIDNNKENVIVAIMSFDNIMGENSTVLYEALSMGKKVGKINFGGLLPRYLLEEDKKMFYQITDDYTFMDFIKASLDAKPSKKLYTEFKPEVINQLLEDNKYAYAK